LINTLFEGPICRHLLRREGEYHVSYNLEEASRLFQLIKNTIDWSTVKLPSAPGVSDDQNSTLEMIHRDTIYARRLQAELNHETVNQPRRRAIVPSRNQPLPTEEMTTGSSVLPTNQPSGHQKGCGHRCDLVSTGRCCECSGKIVIKKDFF
jgi:hypothetical protein